MKIILKFTKEIMAVAVISFLYFLTRVYNISGLPIFTDEAIYTRWSQIAYNDAAWRFISLTDGKQPSFIWFQIIFMRFIEDPLIAGRMVSVFAGFFALVGIFILAQLIFKNKKISFIAAIIYLVYPFALVYDRMALYESLLVMFFVWTLSLQILLVKKLRLDIALILGFSLGGTILTKSSGFLAMYMMPLLFLLLDITRRTLKKNVIKLVLLLAVSVIVANAMYSVLRLSPFFHIIDEKNSIFVYPVGEWLNFQNTDKLKNFLSNSRGILDWLATYFSIPFIVIAIYSFVYRENYRERFLLLLWFLIPFIALGVFGKTIYPRFIFFMTIPLIPLVAYGFYKTVIVIKNKIATLFITIALLSYPVIANYYILFDIERAPIPDLDLEQFVNGWPSGGGVSESIYFFEEEARDKKIVVATQGTFGLLPFAYEIYLGKHPNIEIIGYWPIEDALPEGLLERLEEKDVYFVFYQPCPSCEYPGAAPKSWNIEKIAEYDKGTGKTKLSVYKVE